MLNPIFEAFLLNSDRSGVAGDFEVEEEKFGCDWSGAVLPAIFFSVLDKDSNSEVRSRYAQAPEDAIDIG